MIIPRFIYLFVSALSFFLPAVAAQWVLDNRCARRLSLSAFNSSTFKLSDLKKSVMDEDETNKNDALDNGYWYQSLRGNRNKNGSNNTLRKLNEKEGATPFMMRLHWQEGNCWQGEWIERKWCMACESGEKCRVGDKLWTQFCDNSRGQRFVWIPTVAVGVSKRSFEEEQSQGRLKMAHFNLCLERMTTNSYALAKCDENSPFQVVVGWNPSDPFELKPVENLQKCINQHHHPSPKEEIANTACETAEQFHTNLWQVYRNDNADNEVVRLRRPQCSSEFPCGQCEGDCDHDRHCAGDLICYQRNKEDDWMPVPSCQGFPSDEVDYCVSPDSIFAPPIVNHGLRLRDEPCSQDNPCKACSGDCDSDDDCIGIMKCFMRGENNPLEEVPNCVGEGTPEADYCYQPDGFSSPNMLRVRNVECAEERPCFQCEGDCDDDSDCYGALRCWQRSSNSMEAVPGCSGLTEGSTDYCYVPEDLTLPTFVSETAESNNEEMNEAGTTSTTLDSPTSPPQALLPSLGNAIRKCTEEEPCGICEGDCDEDAQCLPHLVCLQRPWNQPYITVKGCLGRGVAGADYCVEP